MKIIKVAILIAYIFCGTYAQEKNIKDEGVPGCTSITRNDLMETVRFLSSKECAGRLSGHKGYDTAAAYAVHKFGDLNIKPITPAGYFQPLTVEYNEILPPVRLRLTGFIPDKAKKYERDYKLGTDFVCRGFSGSGNVTGQAIFCGYGLSQPKDGYDDYAGVDVRGKIVIAFKPNPSWRINDTTGWSDGYPRDKARTAAKHGAVALIIVSPPNQPNPQKAIISVLEGKSEQDEKFPQLHAEIPMVDEWFEGSGYTLSNVQSIIDSTRKPFSVPLNTVLNVEVHSRYVKDQPTMNVIGWIEGSDPVLKDEYLVIGAHLDHCGNQAGEVIAAGANDNASGSAAVLEMAEAFAKSGEKPKRSVIFVLFASEELGLYGSSWFVDHPPVPLEKIAAMMNLDCIGFGDSIQVGNGLSSPELWKIARMQDSLHIQQMVTRTWSGGGSDAGPFHGKGIPALYFVTTNSYDHLHLPSDTPETLNEPLFESITRLAYLTAYHVANGNYNREVINK
jgi:hypothetical protein